MGFRLRDRFAWKQLDVANGELSVLESQDERDHQLALQESKIDSWIENLLIQYQVDDGNQSRYLNAMRPQLAVPCQNEFGFIDVAPMSLSPESIEGRKDRGACVEDQVSRTRVSSLVFSPT